MQQEDALLALELTDRLLNAWAAAVAAAAPGQQRRQLHKAYSAAKGRLLAALLEQAQALGLGQPGGAGSVLGAECRQRLPVLRIAFSLSVCLPADAPPRVAAPVPAEGEAQLRRVEGLAEAHAAYAQLLDISRLTGDT